MSKTHCSSAFAGLGLWLGASVTLAAQRVSSIQLSLSPSAVVGGNPVAGTIALDAAAPAGGTVVTLRVPSIAIAALVSPLLGPSSAATSAQIRVAEGKTTAPFQMRTFGVLTQATVLISASAGTSSGGVALTVNPAVIQSFTVAPTTVLGGRSVTATIVLDGRAPAGAPLTVTLTGVIGSNLRQLPSVGSAKTAPPPASSTTVPVSVPPTVTIPANGTSVSFALSTTPVAARTAVSLTAVFGVALAAQLLVTPPVPTALQVNPITMVGGTSSTGTVILTGPAPDGGLPVSLTSSSASATIPPSVSIPSGSDRQTFQITTQPVGTVVTAVIGVANTTSNPAPVPDGTSNTIVIGEPVLPAISARITLVPPPELQLIAASPSPVTGGDALTITLSLNTGANLVVSPSTAIVGTAQLITDRADIVNLPPSVPIPGFRFIVTATASTTAPTSDQNVTITATLGSRTVSTSVVVRKPIPPIASFGLRPTTVVGGLNVIASIALTPGVSTAQTVTLTTDHPELVQIPASVTVSPTGVPQFLTLHTSATTASTLVTITAAAGAQRITTTITITP